MTKRTTRGALALTVVILLLLAGCSDPNDVYYGFTKEYGRKHRVCGQQTIQKPASVIKGWVASSFDGFATQAGCNSRDDQMPDGWMGAKGKLYVDGQLRVSTAWKYNNEPFRAWVEMLHDPPPCPGCLARVYGEHHWWNKDANAYKYASSYSVNLSL